MIVGVFIIDIRLFDCHTRKQKRSIVAKLLNRIRSRYPVSVAEVGHLDLLQRAEIGVSMTGSHDSAILSVFRKIEEDIYHAGLVELISIETDFIDYGDK